MAAGLDGQGQKILTPAAAIRPSRRDSGGMEGIADDAALLDAVAAQDLQALRELYERHAGWLAIRLTRRCNDRDLVADAVQDTFVAVWQKPGAYRGTGDVAAWLWRIAIRPLVSRLRHRTDVPPRR